MVGEDYLQEELIQLRGRHSALIQEYENMMRNPKVNRRQLQVLGSKITKVNYAIDNKMMELSNSIESLKR